MAHFKRDALLALIILLLKYTIVPEISWWLVFTPLIIGFSYNFIKGFLDGMEDKMRG